MALTQQGEEAPAAKKESQQLSRRKNDLRKKFLMKIQAPLGPIIPVSAREEGRESVHEDT